MKITRTYNIEEEQADRLREAAHKFHISQSEIVRDGIEMKLKKLERDAWKEYKAQ